MADHEPLPDGGCGEPGLSEELRDALTLLRDHSDNDDFRALVHDVLAGRRGLVEASGTAAPATSSGVATESCGIPCAGCPGMCALRDHSRQ
ncbi:MAG: hypothetical protein ACRDRW_14485 [Pseudonocardiaceae bacterium]